MRRQKFKEGRFNSEYFRPVSAVNIKCSQLLLLYECLRVCATYVCAVRFIFISVSDHVAVIVFVVLTVNQCAERLEQEFEKQLVGSVQSFIDATRRLVTTATYVILLGITASFSLRVAAVLVLRRLAFTSARPQRCQAGFDGEPEDQSTRVDNGAIDDVTDDDDDDVSCQCDVTEYHGGAAAPPPISTRQSENLRSLKYYETNV